uniref:Kazal-like domain-containing protein n=1 Tax=Rhabditophanes sp. KR3021 TaxID=114890 RepID=A0AC35U558_9BILA
MKLSAILLCVLVISIQRSFAEESDDEVAGLINDLDESSDVDPRRSVSDKPVNVCDGHVCGWGKECIDDGKGRPSCQCIKECPTMLKEQDKVCATNNQTFVSHCELYQQKCLCKKKSEKCLAPVNSKIHLNYLGHCKLIEECTEDMMSQFGERMADWLFQVMKELKKRRELHGIRWEELVNEAEHDDAKKHIYPVIWKFCDLDIKPHDRHVTHPELIPMTAFVVPMESCIKPFLESCDYNADTSISIQEWGKCLGLKEGEIQEKC